MNITEELLGRKSTDFDLENRDYGQRDPSRWPRDTLYPQKLALTSPTSGGRSVGIVLSRIQATEIFLPIALWLRRWATSRKVAGSRPNEVKF
jgi:hypothetical protein